MVSLYDQLGISKNATNEEIEKSYKTIAYIHVKNNDLESRVNCNNAYNILKDNWKRCFYNIFGNESIDILLNPVDGYVYPRLFSKMNLTLIILYIMLNFYNIIFLPYLFRIFGSNLLRFIFMILSPLLLMACLLNSIKNLKQHKESIHVFYMVSFNALGLSAVIFNIASYHDKITSKISAIIQILIIELFVGILIYLKLRVPQALYLDFGIRCVKGMLSVLFIMLEMKYALLIIPCFTFVNAIFFKVRSMVVASVLIGIFSLLLYESTHEKMKFYVHIGISIYIAASICAFIYLLKIFISLRPFSKAMRMYYMRLS